MKLAFCGLGLMGEPMVQRLLAAGHTVKVWNRTPAKAQALIALGAQWCDTPAQAASDVDGVFMWCSGPRASSMPAICDGWWTTPVSRQNRPALGANVFSQLPRLTGWMHLYQAAWQVSRLALWP